MPLTIQYKIALRIRQLRREKELSQEKLSIRAGLSRTYFTKVENGNNISMVNLEKIVVEGFDLTLPEFFNDKMFQ